MGSIAELSDFHVSAAALNDLNELKNGHIFALSLQYHPQNRKRWQLVIDLLPEKFRINVTLEMIRDIREFYNKLMKNKGDGSDLLDFFNLPLVCLGSEQLENLVCPAEPAEPVAPVEPVQPAIGRKSYYSILAKNSDKKASVLANENLDLKKENRTLKARIRVMSMAVDRYRKRCYRAKVTSKQIELACEQRKSKLAIFKRRYSRLFNSSSRIRETAAANLQTLRSVHAEEISELRKKNSQIQHELGECQLMVDELQKKLMKVELSAKPASISTKDGRMYNGKIRKAVYNCARMQVPRNNISAVLQMTMRLLCGVELSPLPSQFCISSMISEMRTLALAQAVEAILQSDFVNIAWDATTIKVKHLNEVHVNTDSGHFTLDIATLPGGKATDYARHITDVILKAVECYCALHSNNDIVGILEKVKEKITSTMSDRAAVNRCVSQELKKFLGHDVLELNCNIHPLDSLAIEFRKVIKVVEDECGVCSELYGKDSVMLRAIMCISKMKYKSSGEPVWLKVFLENEGVNAKLLPRYVGNRFHILFSLCGNIRYLLPSLLKYFGKVCGKTAFAKQIHAALMLDEVQDELLVGGLFGKCLTGPWMTCLYRQNSISNLQSGEILKRALNNLSRLIGEPKLLWQTGFRCFDVSPCADDPVGEQLRAFAQTPFSLALASRAAESFKKVMERQLVRYLEGGDLHDLPPERVLLGTNAPADNMVSESNLGLADYLHRKAANVSDAHVIAKVAYATNKTAQWVEKMDDSAIYQVVGKSRLLLGNSKQGARDVKQELSNRLNAKIQGHVHSQHRKLAVMVKSLMQTPDNFSAGVDLLGLNVSREDVNVVCSIVKSPGTLLGKEFMWIWNVESEDVAYHYRVVEQMSKQREKFIALCFVHDSTFDDAQEHVFCLQDFVADFLAGDAFFI